MKLKDIRQLLRAYQELPDETDIHVHEGFVTQAFINAAANYRVHQKFAEDSRQEARDYTVLKTTQGQVFKLFSLVHDLGKKLETMNVAAAEKHYELDTVRRRIERAEEEGEQTHTAIWKAYRDLETRLGQLESLFNVVSVHSQTLSTRIDKLETQCESKSTSPSKRNSRKA